MAPHQAVIPPTTEPVAPSAAADRMRRFRKRRRWKYVASRFKCLRRRSRFNPRGLLAEDARNDPYAVRDALHTHLCSYIGFNTVTRNSGSAASPTFNVTRNANSVKNALEKFPINFDNDETD